ncbi:DEAD/DEAH box helicase [Spiroplasma monobiae]|uniref:Helicase n=1 Tax=Spiroplasma monobiae MQ-1 TaxID=1336748 RepID=A0A2K9LV11_SPISQ|nr:DEAD/DEAH box helicase [Spiroplasma monobiae]AUM62761.1 hypothetical protein SMONO_v1c05120 [Spiroplasma monobiae MQ-1]
MNDKIILNDIVEKIFTKIENNILCFFGLINSTREKIYNYELDIVIFVMRSELFLSNATNNRDEETFEKINKIIFYITKYKYIFEEVNISEELEQEILIRTRNFPYLIENSKINDYELSEYESLKYDNKFFLTKKQIEVFELIDKKNKLVISAPTSFGKSFLIKYSVLKRNWNNCVIILPTNALVSEYCDWFMDNQKKLFSVITNINQDLKKRNLIIMTQEKFWSFFNKEENSGINYDWVIFDEFYSLDLINIRNQILFSILLYLKNFKDIKMTFLSPNSKNLKEGILSFLDGIFFEETFEEYVEQNLVSRDMIYLVNKENVKDKYIATQILNKNDKFSFIDEFPPSLLGKDNLQIMIEIIKKINKAEKNETFLIYPPFTSFTTYCDALLEMSKEIGYEKPEEIKFLIEYLKEYYGDHYSVIKMLERGIAVHFGEIDEFTREIIESQFRKKNIKYLICSPTLMKGVNLNTNYLFITNNRFPDKNIDPKNLVGRIGRYDQSPHGFGFYINSSKETTVKNSIAKKFQENLVIVNKNPKNQTKIDEFIKKINNDKNIKLDKKLISNNNSKSDKTLKSDYFIEGNINKKILFSDTISLEIKQTLQSIFIKENENKLDFLYCKKLLSNLMIIYYFLKEKWKGNTIEKIALIFSWYLKGLTVKNMVLNMAKYYEKFNRETLEERKYRFTGKFITKTNEGDIFSSKNEKHMNILTGETLKIIKSDIEYNLKNSMLHFMDCKFDENEKNDIYDKVEILTNNDLIRWLVKNGFYKNIAITLSKEKFKKIFYKNEIFLNENEIINNFKNYNFEEKDKFIKLNVERVIKRWESVL